MAFRFRSKTFEFISDLPAEEIAHKISDSYREYLKDAFTSTSVNTATSQKRNFVILQNDDNHFELEIEGISKTQYGTGAGVDITASFVPSGEGTAIHLAVDFSRWFLAYTVFMVWVFMANLDDHIILSLIVSGVWAYTVKGALAKFSKAAELAPGLLCATLNARQVKA